MTIPGAAWNEANLSELSEVEHLQRLGQEYVGDKRFEGSLHAASLGTVRAVRPST